MKSFKHLLWFVLVLANACRVPYAPVKHQETLYKIEAQQAADSLSELEVYLKPYREELNKVMKTVIGETEVKWVKEKGGGNLGQLVVKAMLYQKVNDKPLQEWVDGAIMNPGGLRIPELNIGKIELGKIYELLPFDNELVLVKVKGDVLKQWLNHTQSSGGWPVGGRLPLRYQEDKHAPTGKDSSIEDDKMYTLVTNDYIANGGDQCSFLIPCEKTGSGILIRDAMINYIKEVKILR